MAIDVIIDHLPYLMGGFTLTVYIAVASIAGSLVTGIVFAICRLSPFWWIRWPAAIYIDALRTIPILMFIFWFFFLLTILAGRPVEPWLTAICALIAFNTSYMAEVIRSGIQSVPRTQMEAGRSSGLSYLNTMRYIILPQALLYMLPAIVSRFIALFMGTSLAYIIGVTEFFRAANNVNNKVFESFTIYSFVAVVYFISCYCLSLLSRYLERRLAPEQNAAAAMSVSG